MRFEWQTEKKMGRFATHTHTRMPSLCALQIVTAFGVAAVLRASVHPAHPRRTARAPKRHLPNLIILARLPLGLAKSRNSLRPSWLLSNKFPHQHTPERSTGPTTP